MKDLPAAGGEADIALLRDKATREQVIFKSYRAGMGPDPMAMLILRQADERHIVRLLDFQDGADGAWEIQEYCPIGSLRDWVAARGGRLEKTALTAVVREVAGALRYLHGLGSGIAHRDLKPANVLVRTPDPLDLVLTDFGLARAQPFTRLTDTVKGTWHYAAPEVHARQSSAKSDWFSLGAMIYEFYTGRKLFALSDGTEVPDEDARARSLAHNYATDLVDDPRWKLLLDGLLIWDKDNRWGADQVDAWLRGESPEVHDPGPSQAASLQNAQRPGYRPKWSPTLVYSPQELAEQFRLHWDAAAGELAGRPDPGMLRFLEGLGMEDALRVIASTEAPGPKLVRLQGILDPESTIQYGGRALDDASFRELLQVADKGEETSLDWLTAVLREHILKAFAEVTGSKAAARADFLLTTWQGQAEAVTNPLPEKYRAIARQAFRTSLPELFAAAFKPLAVD